MASEITTEHDVTLDLVAALDMYTGLMGSEETTIETLVAESRVGTRYHTVVMTLSNGDVYHLDVHDRSNA